MRLAIFIIFQSIVIGCFGQIKQYWPFGNKVALKFENGQVSVDTFCQLNNWEGTSSVFINDSSFFYSDGRKIYNKLHHQLNLPVLHGDKSATQGSVMLMHPDNDSTIFMFTNSSVNDVCPSHYYELLILNDTSLRLKRSKLLNLFGSEKFSVVNHKNNRDLWILSHNGLNNEFYFHLLISSGIIPCPILNKIGIEFNSTNVSSVGQLKMNLNGDKLVTTTWASSQIELYKFNNENGCIFDSISFYHPFNFGIEFSKSNSYIYTTDPLGNLVQYCIKNWNPDSVFNSRSVLFNKGIKNISGLQIGLDNRIYWSNADSLYVSAINYPDLVNPSCNFNLRFLNLNGRKCNYGLPTFNQSEFYTPSIDFKYDLNCVTNTIDFEGKDTFNASYYKWLIKKTSLTNFEGIYASKSISHKFKDTGVYQVTFIASMSNRADTVIKSITIHPKLKLNFLGNDTAYPKGSSFNLTLKTPLGMHCQMWQDSSGLSTFNVDTAGIFVCKITNKAFCQLMDTIVVSECNNSIPIPIISRHKDTLFSSVLAADSFVWYRGSKYYKTTLKPYIVVKDTGSFKVSISKEGYCNKVSSLYSVKTLKIHAISLEELGVDYFPNPSSGVVFFRAEQSFNLRVFDAIGQEIGSFNNPESIYLNSGVYCLQFEIDGVVIIKRVVIL